MRRAPRFLALATVVAGLAALPSCGEGDFEWRPDFEAARADARKSGRPLLVTFRCVP